MRLQFISIALALLLGTALSQNYCGWNYEDSKKCQTSCPGGVDSECPSGERCYASVTCSAHTAQPRTGSYCGRSYVLSKECRTACPSNTNQECASGETCYANVQCNSETGTGTSNPSTSNSGSPLSEAKLNEFFPSRNPFYSYSGFISATAAYPAFMGSGSSAVRQREAAAFLANIAHESGNLRYIREIATQNWNSYCDANTATANGFSSTCDKNGNRFQYYGRGPIQLSWNFNYLAAGNDFGTDLIHNPDLVATDASVSWKTAIWFWMTQNGAGGMTPHDAIVNGAGFGETIRSINGALECNGRNPATVTTRVNNFQRFVAALGTDVGPGNVRC